MSVIFTSILCILNTKKEDNLATIVHIFMAFMCCIVYLQNGVFIMELFNWYSAGFSLIVVSILEIVAVSYIYGNYSA